MPDHHLFRARGDFRSAHQAEASAWLAARSLRQAGAISRLDTKLDLLLKHAGIEYDPYKNLPLEVIDAVRRGNKIEAIKRSGVSLKQPKDFIEEVQRRAGVGT